MSRPESEASAAAGSSNAAALVPSPKVYQPDERKRGGTSLGAHLEQLRKRLGYAVSTVARELWITESTLDGYESGLREPPPDVLDRMAELYGVDVSTLVSSEAPQSDADALWLGWAELRFDDATGNAERMRAITQTIRAMRHVSEGARVTVRDDELSAVAMHLDLQDPGLLTDLQRWFCISVFEADELRARLIHASTRVQELGPGTHEGP